MTHILACAIAAAGRSIGSTWRIGIGKCGAPKSRSAGGSWTLDTARNELECLGHESGHLNVC